MQHGDPIRAVLKINDKSSKHLHYKEIVNLYFL